MPALADYPSTNPIGNDPETFLPLSHLSQLVPFANSEQRLRQSEEWQRMTAEEREEARKKIDG